MGHLMIPVFGDFHWKCIWCICHSDLATKKMPKKLLVLYTESLFGGDLISRFSFTRHPKVIMFPASPASQQPTHPPSLMKNAKLTSPSTIAASSGIPPAVWTAAKNFPKKRRTRLFVPDKSHEKPWHESGKIKHETTYSKVKICRVVELNI